MTARRPHGGRLVTFGEAMGRVSADQIGLLDTSRTFTVSVGGAESNVAVAAARLGADVTWADDRRHRTGESTGRTVTAMAPHALLAGGNMAA
ncbi:PfkB family carbohydrate kinase [Streptomyces flavovirens]|uniref:PfkB family carbohydrate kinase n=1 Tax=Streptomyces TaxID=1883 RepID=UPI00081B05D6|nr:MULTISPECIES: PfkB family carbohydrate kinase [unclassified Streptomyces]MYX73907.1 hypothetical protein [Streptomyces sp. SID3915]SCE11143.1 pfkB family carbohydrate kinase [Streptomyces sp. BpilaLS-43]